MTSIYLYPSDTNLILIEHWRRSDVGVILENIGATFIPASDRRRKTVSRRLSSNIPQMAGRSEDFCRITVVRDTKTPSELSSIDERSLIANFLWIISLVFVRWVTQVDSRVDHDGLSVVPQSGWRQSTSSQFLTIL